MKKCISTSLCLLCVQALALNAPSLALAQEATPSKASSENDAQAKRMYEAGVSFYEAGRYEAAIEAFEEAYELSQRHVLLLNIASAYERLGELEKTLDVLKRYQPHVEPEKSAALEKRIESLAQRLDEQRAQAQQDQAQVKVAAQTEPNKPKQPAPVADPIQPQPPKQEKGAGALAWTSLIGGGLLLAGGGGMLVWGELQHQDLDDRIKSGELDLHDAAGFEEAQQLNDAADQKKLTGYILMGVGGAATIAGIVLFATSSSDEEGQATKTVSVSFIPAPNGGAFTIQGAF